jgi:hypothetical protein
LGNFLVRLAQQLIADIINGLLKFALSVIDSVMITPFHMDKIPGFTTLQITISGVAIAWIGVIVGKELLMNQLEMFGDTDVNPLLIVKNALVAGILVAASPLLVLDVILPLSSFLLGIVQGTIGSIGNLSNDMIKDLTLDPGQTAGSAFLLSLLPDAGFWGCTLIAGTFMVVACVVAIQSGFRWMELIFLALIGPVLALSKASWGNSWDLWLRETLAVSMSQVVQFTAIVLGMNIFLNKASTVAVNGTSIAAWTQIFLALGTWIFALRGPTTLRSILGTQPNGLKAISSLASAAIRR